MKKYFPFVLLNLIFGFLFVLVLTNDISSKIGALIFALCCSLFYLYFGLASNKQK